jgi:hypothetical protein
MGGSDASLSGWVNRCPWTFFTYAEAVTLPSLWVFFVGMFCLFRAALLSASPAVYWFGMVLKHKGMI